MSWYLYILKCSNGNLYTGVTTDIARRLKEHKQGQGAVFTRSFRAEEICHTEEFLNKREAFSREAQIKRWTRKKKLALIAGNIELLKRL